MSVLGDHVATVAALIRHIENMPDRIDLKISKLKGLARLTDAVADNLLSDARRAVNAFDSQKKNPEE